MALNNRKINKETTDIEIDGAKFVLNRINNKIKKKIDAINKEDISEDNKNNKMAKIVFDDIIVSSKGVNEKWIAKHFVGNDTHYASKKFNDGEDGEWFKVCRASFAEAVTFVKDIDYNERAKIAFGEWLEDWRQFDEPGGELVTLDEQMRETLISDESYEPVCNLIMSYAIVPGEFEKEDLSEKEVKFEYRTIEDKERVIGSSNVIDEIITASNDFNNFIEKKKKDEIKQGKS